MKRLSILITLLLTLFISCKKETHHKIRFEAEFIQGCDECYGQNIILVKCSPMDVNNEPVIHASQMTDNVVWSYGNKKDILVKDGDKVVFSVLPQHTSSTYRYIMRVYIDDKVVSYRECYGPYGTEVIDQGGLNNNTTNVAQIIFTFQGSDFQ